MVTSQQLGNRSIQRERGSRRAVLAWILLIGVMLDLLGGAFPPSRGCAMVCYAEDGACCCLGGEVDPGQLAIGAEALSPGCPVTCTLPPAGSSSKGAHAPAVSCLAKTQFHSLPIFPREARRIVRNPLLLFLPPRAPPA